MRRLFEHLGSSMVVAVVFSRVAHAAYPIPSQYKPSLAPDIGTSEYTTNTISIFLQFLAANLLYFAGAIAVILLVIAGAMYVTAMGNQDQMEKAKKTIQWTVLGLIVMILSFALIQFVLRFFLALPGE